VRALSLCLCLVSMVAIVTFLIL